MGSLRPSRSNAKIRPGSFSHCLVVGRPKSCKNGLASTSLEFNAPHFLCGHPAKGLRIQRFYGQLAITSGNAIDQCPLLGVKRTSVGSVSMSANDPGCVKTRRL